MNYTPQQFDRLPKWAQNEIKKLQFRCDDQQKEMAQLNGDEETNTYQSVGLEKRPLPNNARIVFVTDEETSFEVHVERGELYVRESGCVKKMAITPHVSNVIYIKGI